MRQVFFLIHFTDKENENQNLRNSPKFPFVRQGKDSSSGFITCELCIGKYLNLIIFQEHLLSNYYVSCSLNLAIKTWFKIKQLQSQ